MSRSKPEAENKNSLLYWFPKVSELAIPVPRTHCLLVDAGKIAVVFDGEELEADLIVQVEQAAMMIGYRIPANRVEAVA